MFFVNVCFIYGIQLFLLLLAYYDMNDQSTKDLGFLAIMHFDVTLCRLLLSFLAHL